MASNNGTALGLYDEMSTMYEQLDIYKHAGSRQDRYTLLKLYNGSSWARTFRTVSARVPRTAFNMSGFIQPALLLDLLHKEDVDGFNDRQLFDCPAEIDPMYDQLTPLDTTITLKEVLDTIKDVHKDKEEIIYTLTEDGMSVFTSFHDDIVLRRQTIPDDENRRGVLSKAKGQLARIALALHALEQAVHMLHTTTQEEWSFTIDAQTVNQAVELMNHFISQKFALLPDNTISNDTYGDLGQLTPHQADFVTNNGPYIRKLILTRHDALTPSLVSQLRLMPPSSNTLTPGKTRYPVLDAKHFLKNVVDVGLGTLHTERVERMTPKGPVQGKASVRLIKRKFCELEPQGVAILKRLKITEEEYKSVTEGTPEVVHTSDSDENNSA